MKGGGNNLFKTSIFVSFFQCGRFKLWIIICFPLISALILAFVTPILFCTYKIVAYKERLDYFISFLQKICMLFPFQR